MQIDSLFSATEEAMKKTIEKLKNEMVSIRTGRANSAIIDNIKIESYGSVLPLNQTAGINVPDAKTIEIKPWDYSLLGVIEKAIIISDLGMTPINDGKLISISIPPLTEERRKELAKAIGKLAEEFRVAIRNERRNLLEAIKKSEKDKIITEDERKKAENQAQKITDVYIKKIDESIALKEKEIMRI
ncbi:MAG: ribosome recycling factor [Elusimicrobiota bacterium]|jgi:ribosome recycling factor|nr:ribosome recycling factor [Elusimicrobiota bacterium]